MESFSSKFLISSTLTKFHAGYSIKPRHTKKLGANFPCLPFTIRSKKCSYQDFQEYAKPSKLLPGTEVRVFTDASSLENAFSSFSTVKPESLYKVKLQTSKIYGSDVSDVNSGVLLCLIDENGSSILQRLPASSVRSDTGSEDVALHFQRGSIDEFAFGGPNLGRILAVWISLESGQWRIGDINLTVICPTSAEMNQESTKQLTGSLYNFELDDDILLGEKSEAPMMELRPHSVTAFSENESTLFCGKPSTSSNEEDSMKDYEYLKLSSLFYNTVLVLAGSSIASILTGENTAYAFLAGGLCGFFYLLLLQKSVDELPAPELVSTEKKGSLGRLLKGPIWNLVLAFALGIAAVKYASGEDAVKLAPNDLIFGMMGFLVCKVSVVLAAFKPMPLSFRDDKLGS